MKIEHTADPIATARLIRYLLGDPCRPVATIQDWLGGLREKQRNLACSSDSSAEKLDFETFFELGCAQLHDSRLEEAVVSFHHLSALSTAMSGRFNATGVLWRLGQGRTQSLLRKYPTAE